MLRTTQLPQSSLSSRYGTIWFSRNQHSLDPCVKRATRSHLALTCHPKSMSNVSTQMISAPQARTYRAGQVNTCLDSLPACSEQHLQSRPSKNMRGR